MSELSDDKIRNGFLFDTYGPLLTEHQQKIYEAYAYEDLSLGEIAKEMNISRQGVSDLIHRCTDTMEGYESRLKVIDKSEKLRQLADKCDSSVAAQIIEVLDS